MGQLEVLANFGMKAARDVLATLLGSVTVHSIVGTDLEGRKTMSNVRAQRLLGYSEAEMPSSAPDVAFASKGRELRAWSDGPDERSAAFADLVEDRLFDTRETTYLTRDDRTLTTMQIVPPTSTGAGL